jgi:signal transduction histidine kinase
MPAIEGLIEEFRAAGVAVSVQTRGTPWPLSPLAVQAADRVIEEGLTNAIRHAPGRPVSVATAWEAGLLRLTIENPADCHSHAAGSGLADLAGRLDHAGGSLSHEMSGGQFRLCAALPATALAPEATKRPHMTALGLLAGILLLVVLPAVVLLGVG